MSLEPPRFAVRKGEVLLPFDPAQSMGGPRLMYIGRIRTPWKERADAPRNLPDARRLMVERGQTAMLEVDKPFRPGLESLAFYGHIIVMYWMHEADRRLIVQNPKKRPGLHGVFSLRSPARPNPIALSTVRILNLDQEEGRIEIDAIDCVDGTPLIDIRPWVESLDAPDGSCREQSGE